MVCNTCGREITNEAANFCEYCGASLRAADDPFGGIHQQRNSSGARQTGQAAPYYHEQNWNGQARKEPGTYQRSSWFGTNKEADKEPVISFGKWLILMLVLPMIPMIGPIIYLVVLFVIAFGKTQPATLKNWARAMLVMLVAVAIMLAAMVDQMAFLLNSII